MKIDNQIAEVINNYIRYNGKTSIMDKNQLYSLVSEKYKIKKNSFLPADFCYNRMNVGIDFKKHIHLFEMIEEGKYLVLGEGYPYSGLVYYRKRGETEVHVAGKWLNGEFMNNLEMRLNDLFDSIKQMLVPYSIKVVKEKSSVYVMSEVLEVCKIDVVEEAYKVYGFSPGWKKHTSYYCEKAEDGSWYYYVDTIDECIGELERMIEFEVKRGNISFLKSELRHNLTVDLFGRAFSAFLEQAEENARSRKSTGNETPLGFKEANQFDGEDFTQHFGQGAASKTPYMNWWIVSIYYITESKEIVLGIEEDRADFRKIDKMEPLKKRRIGNKTKDVAVFYETEKEKINYQELYEKFICVSEHVMRLR